MRGFPELGPGAGFLATILIFSVEPARARPVVGLPVPVV